MKIIRYSYARNNLRAVLDELTDNNEPTCIVSNSCQVVLMSKKQYDTITKIELIGKFNKLTGEGTVTSSSTPLTDLINKQSKDWSDKK